MASPIGDNIVYYEESIFVLEIVHPIYIYIYIYKLQLNIILFHNQKFIHIIFFLIFTQLSQLSYFAHINLNTFWPSEMCVPMALHHSNTSILF